jgi:adenosine deaminase
VKDKVNFGLNTDDSSIIGITISNECKVAVKEINMTLDQVIETMFNAGRSCFLPDEEKASLLAKLAVLVAQYKENLSR